LYPLAPPQTQTPKDKDNYDSLHFKDIVGRKEEKKVLKKWIEKRIKGRGELLAVIDGCHGTGKSTLAAALLKKYKLSKVELDSHSGKKQIFSKIKKIIDSFSIESILSTKNSTGIVIENTEYPVEPIDLVRILEDQQYTTPIIIIGNKKISKKIKNILYIYLEPFSKKFLYRIATNHLKKNEKRLKKKVVEQVVHNSNNDIRKLLQNLKLNCIPKRDCNTSAVSRTEVDIFLQPRNLVKGILLQENNNFDSIVDPNHANLLLHENAPRFVNLEKCMRVLDFMSSNDIMNQFIFENQCWPLYQLNTFMSTQALKPLFTDNSYTSHSLIHKSQYLTTLWPIKNNRKKILQSLNTNYFNMKQEEVSFAFRKIILPKIDEMIENIFLKTKTSSSEEGEDGISTQLKELKDTIKVFSKNFFTYELFNKLLTLSLVKFRPITRKKKKLLKKLWEDSKYL